MTNEPKVIKDWIEHCMYHIDKLTKWESDFIESIFEQFSSKNSISDKQEEILERIYAHKTP